MPHRIRTQKNNNNNSNKSTICGDWVKGGEWELPKLGERETSSNCREEGRRLVAETGKGGRDKGESCGTIEF